MEGRELRGALLALAPVEAPHAVDFLPGGRKEQKNSEEVTSKAHDNRFEALPQNVLLKSMRQKSPISLVRIQSAVEEGRTHLSDPSGACTPQGFSISHWVQLSPSKNTWDCRGVIIYLALSRAHAFFLGGAKKKKKKSSLWSGLNPPTPALPK